MSANNRAGTEPARYGPDDDDSAGKRVVPLRGARVPSGEVIPLLPPGELPELVSAKPPPKRGLLVIDKPVGPTSHDIVQAIRTAGRVRRVGHGGTLDPSASGVLVVAVGSATRVLDELLACSKEYLAVIKLGETTTTYDREGEFTQRVDASGVTLAQVEAALASFRGEIRQTPPAYAALKREGKPLYALARAGSEFDLEPRAVAVHDLELVGWQPPQLTLRLDVSRGFYVRSLAHDLGQALGVGGHLSGLRRSRVGPFSLEQAVTLEQARQAFEEGWWMAVLRPLDEALLDYPALIVGAPLEQRIRQGQRIPGPQPQGERDVARAYNERGEFIGTLRYDYIYDEWQPVKVFPP